MILLSFNSRGVGGPKKKLALKRILLASSPDIILIQETMCLGDVAIKTVSPLAKKLVFQYCRCIWDVRGVSYMMESQL
jgi:ABC-type uncharacterized transport system YnjBCD ATPase subunit